MRKLNPVTRMMLTTPGSSWRSARSPLRTPRGGRTRGPSSRPARPMRSVVARSRSTSASASARARGSSGATSLPALSVHDQLLGASRPARHHRPPGGHRLDDHAPEALRTGREAQAPRSIQHASDLGAGDLSGHRHARRDPRLLDAPPELVAHGAGADDLEPRAGTASSTRGQASSSTSTRLVALEHADERHARARRPAARAAGRRRRRSRCTR